ncbi:autotransporter domain-containing protein [Haematospirillum jordaniae]|uniref:autotransporter outer membrane beta-barrel domain-containing protein n=1 Tax=Haematospirillum jordaniae TaxID=1549855 RepID=UPI001433054F|nr:autotransporter outer membrane beta-barrel domain-containing protein [Haematospirillum jordaniae]NKD85085.1 autotransporter domain-containing protein [Haematospirillum jordaniae]
MSEIRTNLLATTALAAALSLPGVAYATTPGTTPLNEVLSQSFVDTFIKARNDAESKLNFYRKIDKYRDNYSFIAAIDPAKDPQKISTFRSETEKDAYKKSLEALEWEDNEIGKFADTTGTHPVAFSRGTLKTEEALQTERQEAAKKALKAKLGGMVITVTSNSNSDLAAAVRGLAGIGDSDSITEAHIATALDKALEKPVPNGKTWEQAKTDATTALSTAESDVAVQEKDNAVSNALGALTPPSGLKMNRQTIKLEDTTVARDIQQVITNFRTAGGTVADTVYGKIEHGSWKTWRENAGLTALGWGDELNTYEDLKTFLGKIKSERSTLENQKSGFQAEKEKINKFKALREYVGNTANGIIDADGNPLTLATTGALKDAIGNNVLDPVIDALATKIGNGITKETDTASTTKPNEVNQNLWDQFVAAKELKAAQSTSGIAIDTREDNLNTQISSLDSLAKIEDTFIDEVVGLQGHIATENKKTPGDDIAINDSTTLGELQALKSKIHSTDTGATAFITAIDNVLKKYEEKKGATPQDTETIGTIKSSLGNRDLDTLKTTRDTARAEYHAFLARHGLLGSPDDLNKLNTWKNYVDSNAQTFEAVKSHLDSITGADQEGLITSLTDAISNYATIEGDVNAYNTLKQQYNTLRTSLVNLGLVGNDEYKDVTAANVTALVDLAKKAKTLAKGAELEQATADTQTALEKAIILEGRGTRDAPDDKPVNIGQDGTIEVDGTKRHRIVNGGLHSTEKVRLGATGDGAKVVVNGEVSSKKSILLWGDKPVEVQDTHGNIEAEGDGAGYLISTHAKTNIAPQNIGTKNKQLGKFEQRTEAGNTKTYEQFHVTEALLRVNNGGTATTIITEDASGDIWTVGEGMTVEMRGDATGLKKVVGENDGDGTILFSANADETKILKTQLGAAGKRLGRVEYRGGIHKREVGAPSYDYVKNVFIRNNTVFEDNIAVTYSNNVTNQGTHKTNAATTVKGSYTNNDTHDINAAMNVEGDYTNTAGSTLNLNNRLDVVGKFTSGNGSQVNMSAENPNAGIKANSFDFDKTTLNVSGVVNKAIRVFEGTVTEDELKEIILKIENNAYNNILDYRMVNKGNGSYLIGFSNSAKTADLVSSSGASATVAKAFASGLAVAEKTRDSDLRKAYETVLLSGNVADIKLAAEQSTTSSNVAATQAITGASRAAAGAVSTRLAATRGEAQTAGLQQSGIAAGDDTRRNGAWMKVTGGIATQKARNGVAGNRTNTYGATIGLDNKVTETLRLGGALSYAQSDVKGKDSGQSKTDINSYQVALYGSYEPGQYFVEGQLAWAYNTIKTSRRITFGGLNRTASGEYDAHQYSASTAVGMPLHKGAVTLTPKAGMFYSYNSPSSYTETGAEGSNLTINPPSTQILEGSLGGVVAYHHTMRSGAELRPELRAAALYEFLGDDATATAKYAGAGATIQTPGLKPSKMGGTVGAGMGYTTSDGMWEVRADYDAEMRAGYVSHNGMLTGRINF